MDVWSKELLWAITKSGRTQEEHSPDKVGPPLPKVPSLFTTQAHGLCHGTSRALELNWWVYRAKERGLGSWTSSASLPHHRLGFRPSWDKMGRVASG